MNDLVNPQNWNHYMSKIGSGGATNLEFAILFFLMIILLFVFIWEYIKNNQV